MYLLYIIRFGAEDWMIMYLKNAKGIGLEKATGMIASLPLVGICWYNVCRCYFG